MKNNFYCTCSSKVKEICCMWQTLEHWQLPYLKSEALECSSDK